MCSFSHFEFLRLTDISLTLWQDEESLNAQENAMAVGEAEASHAEQNPATAALDTNDSAAHSLES